jgi:transcriptional regulator with XRE-family HTH domain
MSEMDDPEKLAGREFRRLREARGWSQEKVADRMKAFGYDWHQTQVSRTEVADRPLRLNEAAALCRLFEVRLEALLADMPGITFGDLEDLSAARAARLESKIARLREVLGDEDDLL